MSIKNIVVDGFIPYKFSFRALSPKKALCIVKKDKEKYICLLSNEKENFSNIIKKYEKENIYIFKLNWENYLKIKNYTNLTPKKINKKESFGTGDRTGLASAAQIKSLSKYDIFPVLVQGTPNEILGSKQNYRNLILNGVMGILEHGYQGNWGADANNITKNEDLLNAIEANFSMYTIDISNHIQKIDYVENNIEELSKKINQKSINIINQWTNKDLFNGEKNIILNRDNLVYSACLFEKSMENAISFYKIIKENIEDFDFEISMNKSPRITSASDYVYCINYLQNEGVKVNLISPKYIGTFNPSYEYEGNKEEFYKQVQTFKSVINILQNHKLSLHSSDKFSIYEKFKEINDNKYHIKTSGTSWLKVPMLCALHNQDLYFKILEIATKNKDKKYTDVNPLCIKYNKELCSLLNSSFKDVINELGDELFDFLKENEGKFYYLIEKNIDKHLL